MIGNDCYIWQAQPLDMEEELQNTAIDLSYESRNTVLDFEAEWEQVCANFNDFEMERELTGADNENFEEEKELGRQKFDAKETGDMKPEISPNKDNKIREHVQKIGENENVQAPKELGLQKPVKKFGDNPEIPPKKENRREPRAQEIRMQEIEAMITEKAIFRNINGNLCIWNERYYRQLDLSLFTQEVRRLMPKEAQNRISRFSRFREAYDYMLANENLRGKFKEKDITAAKHMIAFKNGLYDAEKGRLIKSQPRYPVLFEIDAKYLDDPDVETPYMDQVINKATGNDADVLERFYQSLGYLYSQGIEAKRCVVLGTAPDSGKSLIGEFIQKTIGSDNVSNISLNNLGARFALGTINQKVLNCNMDLQATVLDKNAVQRLKQLTGDVRIDCEEKYLQSKSVIHHCKFLFATKHPIRLAHEDEAFYRRLLLIPFVNSVAEKDKDYQLPEKIWAERDAIATRAAHAYCRLYKNNTTLQVF